MPTIGFNICILQQPDADPESPQLLEKWRRHKKIYENFLGHANPLVVYRGLTIPNMLVTVSPWAEASAHLDEFSQSEQLDEYLEEFGDTFDLLCAFDINRKWEEAPLECDYITIYRYTVDEDKAQEFEDALYSFLPNFKVRWGSIHFCMGWLMPGAWTQYTPGDEAESLGGVTRTRTQSGVDEGDEDRSNTREWVTYLGWPTEKALKDAFAELEVPYKDRDIAWKGLDAVVAASRQVTIWNVKRVHYE